MVETKVTSGVINKREFNKHLVIIIIAQTGMFVCVF